MKALGRTKTKVGLHYALAEQFREYFVCLKCHRYFPKQYSTKQTRVKQYGTKQLMALWAWHNFERHLISCWNKESER